MTFCFGAKLIDAVVVRDSATRQTLECANIFRAVQAVGDCNRPSIDCYVNIIFSKIIAPKLSQKSNLISDLIPATPLYSIIFYLII
jgi:hypothetical protein